MRYTMLGVVFLVSAAAFAAAPDKPIWLWTPAERVGVRTEHFAQARSGPRVQSLSVGAADSRTALVIDGSQTPELFMPSELMAMLLDTYSLPPASRSAARRQYHAAMVSFHWNEDAFWKDIDVAAASYFQAALANQGKARSTSASRAICAQRATALEQMRKRYANFDRFLYGPFAARQTLSTSEDQSESWLVWMNGGCR
jgi:hypothetical protein